MSNVLEHLRPFGLLAALLLAVLTVFRIVLVFLWNERVLQSNALGFVMTQGLRFDLVLLGMVLIPTILLLPILATSALTLPVWRIVLVAWFTLLVVVVTLMELSTPAFAEQFDARPNILFFEYAEHPREILATLWGAYRVQLLFGIPLVLSFGWLVQRLLLKQLQILSPLSPLVALPLAIAMLSLSVLCARSTFDHRPVNPSTVARTNDALVNDLALNSTYSVSYAAYEMRHEENGGARYSDMSDSDALVIVRNAMQVPESAFANTRSTWHVGGARQERARPRNLVILLQESLGAEFVGSLGGLDLTPTIDALREEGLSFDRLYATGTRSVRGIEAVTTGFPPTPSRSVVKLSKSQRDFFTIGRLLKDQGYDTSFIYGGEAHFDNMRRFFVNNGFDTIIDEKNYVDPVFTGSWGVSDEDLMTKAHETFTRQGDRPFFSLVFSSSNHTPFDFPDGRIELFDEEKQTVNNAVKYADYAIGEFFKKARAADYWKNTVFLVVADHNSRVYGADLVPVKRFHIPAVVVGGGIEPHHYDKVASQIDLPPTLLSLIGIRAEHPMPGRDLLQLPDDIPGRAIMQFNAIQAYMQDNEVVVLQKDVEPQGFTFNGTRLVDPDKPDLALVDLAIGHATWSSATYENGNYKVRNLAADTSATSLVDEDIVQLVTSSRQP